MKFALKIAIFGAAAYAAYYLVSRLKNGGVNPDAGGTDFGYNGAYSMDSWENGL